MAQVFTCEDHGQEGILYLSTLQGNIKTMTLCADCMPDFITGWAVHLGLHEQWREQIRAELTAELDDGEEWHYTGTKEQWDAAVAAARKKWPAPPKHISPQEWREKVAAPLLAAFARHHKGQDEPAPISETAAFDPSGTDAGEQPSDEQLADAVAWVDEREAAARAEGEG